MLDKDTKEKIIEAVRIKPRTVHELSKIVEKNWRTADRYINTIATETGLIASRTFREGSRGALKVVYWNALDTTKGSVYQERLLQKIISGRKKEDFSPFDIYQFLEETEFSVQPKIKSDKLILGAEKQILFFSGNLSWMELGPNMHNVLEECAKKKIKIKVLTRVDITSQKNTEKMLALNARFGSDIVEVRHCEQPLRAMIIDDSLATIKEVLSHEFVREIKKKMFLFYLIKDPEWITWLQKVFYHLWTQSIDAKERMDALKSVQVTFKKNKIS